MTTSGPESPPPEAQVPALPAQSTLLAEGLLLLLNHPGNQPLSSDSDLARNSAILFSVIPAMAPASVVPMPSPLHYYLSFSINQPGGNNPQANDQTVGGPEPKLKCPRRTASFKIADIFPDGRRSGLLHGNRRYGPVQNTMRL